MGSVEFSGTAPKTLELASQATLAHYSENKQSTINVFSYPPKTFANPKGFVGETGKLFLPVDP